MAKHDRISSLFWLLFGSFIVFYSVHHLDLGAPKEPGPGFFLFISGAGVCLTSIMIFTKAMLSKEKEVLKIFSGIIWIKPALILVILFFYIYFFKKLGFILDTFLLMIFLYRSIEPQSWGIAILSSFLTVLVTWFIFGYWFGVQFPAGILSLFGLSW
jgi:putative tricarboxylic transport membrane protein